ncbi:hypothetical protein PROFUN_02955 [Planoprotostelium fungivorum]|uniref:Transmembrane protein n=1 Tax=Planoprotostelium fungivorum TaxID=1890364 RepID=A0A2P6NX44_9EUKA|nr:hypothetical protein PROFUN_02955 [Planoprotostelium fungivorum]
MSSRFRRSHSSPRHLLNRPRLTHTKTAALCSQSGNTASYLYNEGNLVDSQSRSCAFAIVVPKSPNWPAVGSQGGTRKGGDRALFSRTRTMISHTLFVLLFVIVQVVTCDARNATDDGANCVCQYDGTCRCFLGYFGPNNTNSGGSGDSCPFDATVIPGAIDDSIHPVMMYQQIIFFPLCILEIYRLVLDLVISRNHQNPSHTSNAVVWWILFLLVIHSSLCVIESFNYWGMIGNFTYQGYLTIFFLKDRVLMIVFSALLFYWAELYYSAIRKMKREQMLQKIKPGYQSTLTIEDVMLKLHFVSKFRFAYVGVAVLNITFYVTRICTHLFSRSSDVVFAFQTFDNSFMAASWILFFGGYIFYGFRLLQILPPALASRIRTMIILLCLYALFGLANQLTEFGLGIASFDGLQPMKFVFAFATFHWLCSFTALNIFMPVWEWHRWLNPRVVRSMIISTKSSTTDAGSKDEAKSRGAMSSDTELAEVELPTSPPIVGQC